MPNELGYERILQECLRGELRVLNAHIPRHQKSLSALLQEEHPHIICRDGSTHFFKKKELGYLESLINADEKEALLLPMLIEVGSNQDEVAIICEGQVEEKIISKILDMSVTRERGRIRLYKPQLGVLRRVLKTTTQYLFSHQLLNQATK